LDLGVSVLASPAVGMAARPTAFILRVFSIGLAVAHRELPSRNRATNAVENQNGQGSIIEEDMVLELHEKSNRTSATIEEHTNSILLLHQKEAKVEPVPAIPDPSQRRTMPVDVEGADQISEEENESGTSPENEGIVSMKPSNEGSSRCSETNVQFGRKGCAGNQGCCLPYVSNCYPHMKDGQNIGICQPAVWVISASTFLIFSCCVAFIICLRYYFGEAIDMDEVAKFQRPMGTIYIGDNKGITHDSKGFTSDSRGFTSDSSSNLDGVKFPKQTSRP